LLREDHAFPSLAALREQIALDCDAARHHAHVFPEAADPDPVGG
jgi:hypothetical protein